MIVIKQKLESINLLLKKHLQLTISYGITLLGRHHFKKEDFGIVKLSAYISELDPVFSGYKVVHITDLHLGHWLSVSRLNGVVDLINLQKPDTIAITGDFVSYVVDEISDDYIKSLSRLKPEEATLAVLGNHDHWLDSKKVRNILKDSRIVELKNDAYKITRKKTHLYFAGVDDSVTKNDRLGKVLNKLPKKGPVILLAHEPDFADISSKSNRFSFQLSGHSHGGQVVFPHLGPIIRGKGFKKYPLGIYKVGSMVLYTNPGLGTHIFRLRYNCKPEITVITLHPAKKGETTKLIKE